MVSMRFPFSSFPKPPSNGGVSHFSSRSVAIAAAACSAAAAAVYQSRGSELVQKASSFLISNIPLPNGSDIPIWASLSLAAGDPVTENRTGVTFPATVGDSRRLLGVGLRRKSVFGLKNIDVYAFGVYADNGEISEFLGEKYGKVSLSETKNNDDLINELMESDIGMTVRLQIVFGKLSIGSVRSAFEVSVGSKIRKYGGSDNKELLQRFTSQFKDEYKIPRGSIIDLSRERDNVLRTTIDGKEVGNIQSKLLCRSVLDLYIGDDPFDRKAKEEIELNLVSLIQK